MTNLESMTKEANELLEFCNSSVAAKREMGCDVKDAEVLCQTAAEQLKMNAPWGTLKFLSQARKLLRSAKPDPKFPFTEPSSYEDILAELPTNGAKLSGSYDFSDYEDKVLGGWLGKNIGGAHGGPVEGWSREKILKEHGEIWDYVQKPSTLNDDTAYEIVAIHVMQKYGLDFTPEELALEWVEHLPQACTAEKIALDNLKTGLFPPESGTYENPYSEWIGAQMKGEIWGLVAPGKPDVAAEYAYKDGIVAHEKNGVYGEIFDSVMVSAAFVEHDPRKLLEIGLSYVPKNSRLTKVVRDSIEMCDSSKTWQEAADKADASWFGNYDWVHTFPNLAYVTIGMLFGEGDFEKTLCITNMCGRDTDCTAGQVAAIMGVIYGAEKIPAKWKDPIGDKFETYVIFWEDLQTSKIAEMTCDLGRKLMAKK